MTYLSKKEKKNPQLIHIQTFVRIRHLTNELKKSVLFAACVAQTSKLHRRWKSSGKWEFDSAPMAPL